MYYSRKRTNMLACTQCDRQNALEYTQLLLLTNCLADCLKKSYIFLPFLSFLPSFVFLFFPCSSLSPCFVLLEVQQILASRWWAVHMRLKQVLDMPWLHGNNLHMIDVEFHLDLVMARLCCLLGWSEQHSQISSFSFSSSIFTFSSSLSSFILQLQVTFICNSLKVLT